MKRRKFIKNLAGLGGIGIVSHSLFSFPLPGSKITPKKIIIRSGWSLDSLGERLYLPAVYRMVQKNVPGAEIYFWPYVKDEIIFNKINANITKLRLLSGDIDIDGNSDSRELLDTLNSADLVFHAGGVIPGKESAGDPADLHHSAGTFDYCKNHKIKIGIHSLKLPSSLQLDDTTLKILNTASFLYTSYPIDDKLLAGAGVSNKNAGEAPDASFFFDMEEDSKASHYLNSVELGEKNFLLINLRTLDAVTGDLEAPAQSEKFLQLIQTWISETGNPVLVIAAKKSDSGFIQQNLILPLEPALKPKVIFRDDFPDPSEALSIINKSRICVGNEPFISAMAISSRVPTIFTRTSRDDHSHEIFENASLDKWIVDLNSASQEDLLTLVRSIQKNYVNSLVIIDAAMKSILRSEYNSFNFIDKQLGISKSERLATEIPSRTTRPRY